MTQEEIKATVLAECERLWQQRKSAVPNSPWHPETNPKNFIDGLYPLSVTPEDDAWVIAPQYGHSAAFTAISLREAQDCNHIVWMLAYRLLGLNTPPAQHAAKDENGLLPCPFCKGKAMIHYQIHDLEDYTVKCTDCGSETCLYGMRVIKADAIEDWNRRLLSPADTKWERLKAEIVSRNEAEVEAIKSLPPIGLPQSVRDAAYATGHVLGWIQGTMTRIEQEESK